MKKSTLGLIKSDFIGMTIYRVFLYKDKEREKADRQNDLKEKLFSAIKKAIEVLSEKYKSILYLNDFVIIEEEKYLKSA